ncbi:MAG: flagellar protein FlgN [Phycisphaerales bacterium]|nr:flagellar protein FlgN [Phycisphaerales bacterium]
MNITRPIREEDWVESLQGELALRTDLLDQLERAVARQDALIERSDASGLRDLLTERQSVVERIESGAERLACLLDRFEQEGGRLAGERVATIRELVARISRRLDAVLAADARTEELMKEAMRRLRGELEETAVTNRAVSAYHTTQPSDARFSDRKA